MQINVEKLRWKARRLKLMTAAEIGWRIGQSARTKLEAAGFGLCKPLAPEGQTGAAWLAELPRQFDSRRYTQSADRILAGRFDVFALESVELGFPPNWHRDPKTGTEVPAVFGKSIDYRDETAVGDVKYLWEVNRHLELVTLAQAWHLTGTQRYALACRTLIESWLDQCPYPLGPNWTSSLEHAYRLINWSVAWHLLGGNSSILFDGDQGARFKARWLQSVRQHCYFIEGWFSRYSSANNHLLGEYSGLFIGALTWPLWPESPGWLALARRGVLEEALLQTSEDGVNREQAIYYQHEVMDMMLLCGLFARANGQDFAPDFWHRLEQMMDFLAALMDRSGNLPAFGDSDDALLVRWMPDQRQQVYRSLLTTGSILFGRLDWKTLLSESDDKTRWLLGDDAASGFARMPAATAMQPKRIFDTGGLYLLGCDFGTDREVKVVVDCGPIGYLSIAAHGHADALQMTLSVAGRQILIDPGTFAYHTEQRWRDYFRSTMAHNTVCINGLDQSVSGGNFLWMEKAKATCLEPPAEGPLQRFVGEHDGYRRLNDPLTHRRTLDFSLAGKRLTVTDRFECEGRHSARICWHFAEDCQVSVSENAALIVSGPVSASMTLAESDSHPSVFHGCDTVPAGWISRGYDEKTPTTSLFWDLPVQGETEYVTIIDIEVSDPHP